MASAVDIIDHKVDNVPGVNKAVCLSFSGRTAQIVDSFRNIYLRWTVLDQADVEKYVLKCFHISQIMMTS